MWSWGVLHILGRKWQRVMRQIYSAVTALKCSLLAFNVLICLIAHNNYVLCKGSFKVCMKPTEIYAISLIRCNNLASWGVEIESLRGKCGFVIFLGSAPAYSCGQMAKGNETDMNKHSTSTQQDFARRNKLLLFLERDYKEAGLPSIPKRNWVIHLH